MRKQLFRAVTILGLFLTLAVAAGHAEAQSGTKLQATIPFDFTVGETKLQSGKYTVRAMNAAALMIRSNDARSVAMRLTNAINTNNASAKTKLVFHRYGQSYFLAEVWTAGDSHGRQLLKSKQERSIERKLAATPSKSELQAKYERLEIFGTLQ